MSEEKAIEIAEAANLVLNGYAVTRDVSVIQAFIKQHHAEMFAKWSERSAMGYFGG